MMHKKYKPNESNLNNSFGIPNALKLCEDKFENTSVEDDEANPKTNPAMSNRCAVTDAFRLSC